MEYCCHVLAGASSCYLEMLDKLQKQIYRTVDPLLATSLEPLAHRGNVARLSLSYRYFFGRCSSELAQLVPFHYSRWWSTHYSDRLHDFSVTIPKYYKDVCVNSFFSRTAKLWNSMPKECFPLTYDLNGLSLELTSLLNCVPYVLTCQRALRAYVFTCQRALRAYLLTCQRALRAYVLVCKHAILNNVNL